MHILLRQWIYYSQSAPQRLEWLGTKCIYSQTIAISLWIVEALQVKEPVTPLQYRESTDEWVDIQIIFRVGHTRYPYSLITTCTLTLVSPHYRLETLLSKKKLSMHQSYQINHHSCDDPSIMSNLGINHQWYISQIFTLENMWHHLINSLDDS